MALVVKNLPADAGDIKELVQSLSWEDPLEEDMATHSSILAWRIPMSRGAWGLQSMGSQESDTTERLSTVHWEPATQAHHFKGFPGGSDGKESACNTRDLGWKDPLEKGLATHSSILA